MKSHKTSRRYIAIKDLISQKGSASVQELAAAMGVSDETIRRDAKILEEKGEILKLHGALALPHLMGEAPFERRLRENSEAKRRIAKRAVQMVQDGESLMLDTGTTTSIFAQELRVKRGLTIVTNSSDIAKTLATVNGNTVYMAGGALKGDNGAAFGPTAVDFFAKFHVKHAFISIGAISAENGPMDADLSEALIAHMAISRSDNRVILSDASKFGKTALVRVCDFSEITHVITDQNPAPELRAAMEAAGIMIEVAN